jgi:hypothetical protein
VAHRLRKADVKRIRKFGSVFCTFQLRNNDAGDVIQVPLLQRKSSPIEAVRQSLSVFPGRQCSYYVDTMVSFLRLVTRYPVLLNLEWFVGSV